MAKFCAHCGNQLTEEEKFCPVCGTPVEQPAAPVQPDQQEKGATQPAPQPHKASFETFQPQGEVPHKSGRGKWIALVILLMLLAVGAGIFFARQKDDKSAAEPKPPVTQEEKKQGTSAPKTQPKAEGADQKAADGKKTDKSFGKITGTDVRLRAGAGTNTDIVDYFDEGEKVEITGRKDNWYRVKRDNGQTGYVSVQFCRRL
jgi:hypothetical protein